MLIGTIRRTIIQFRLPTTIKTEAINALYAIVAHDTPKMIKHGLSTL